MSENVSAKQVSKFWSWFDSYQRTLNDAVPCREHHLDAILGCISKIEPGLAIELSVRPDGVKEMTISADGVREKFHIVEQIASQAPTLDGWEIIAFRQPVSGDFSLHCGDLELTPADLYFLPLEEDGVLDVIIYGSGFSDQDRDELSYHGLILIDNLIGEYNCVTQVRHYDFQELPNEQDREGLLPLLQLAAFIEARK